MIVDGIVCTCPKCGSENIVKNGHDYKGAQKYHCHDCGAYGTLDNWTLAFSGRKGSLTSWMRCRIGTAVPPVYIED